MSGDNTITFDTFLSKHEGDKKPQEFTPNFGTLAALEAQFKLESSLALTSLGAAHLSFMAWHARKREGQNVGTWEDWNLGLAWVRRKEKPEAGGPTEADA